MSRENMNDIMDEIRADASAGISVSESVIKLHEKGMSVVASVRIIRKAYGLGMGEAKELVANHRVWKSLTESLKPFHDELVAETEKEVFSERHPGSKYRYEILLMKKSELEKQLKIIQAELGNVKSEISSMEKEAAGY